MDGNAILRSVNRGVTGFGAGRNLAKRALILGALRLRARARDTYPHAAALNAAYTNADEERIYIQVYPLPKRRTNSVR